MLYCVSRLSISEHDVVVIFIVITLNLYMAFGNINILMILILPIQEYGKLLHLLMFPPVSFFKCCVIFI